MGKFRKNWTILLFLLFGIRLGAQTEVQIGNGTQTGYVPLVAMYTASYGQSIYLSTELPAGLITSISYQYALSEDITVSPTTIYMAEVSRSSYGGNTDRVPADSLTQVFTGSVTFTQGWVTINLTTPFNYTGDGNLVVAYLNNSAEFLSWEESYFYVTPTTENMSNIAGTWEGTLDISNIGSGWDTYNESLAVRPNTKFMFSSAEDFCNDPQNVTVTEITDNSALVSWTAPEGQTTFGVSYKLANANEWTFLSNVIGTSYTLEGLQGLTDYQVKVYTVCDEESTSFGVVKSFQTSVSASQISSLPYSESFDEATSISSWLIDNGNATNKWYWGVAENNTTEVPNGGSLYISSNGGTTASYDNEAASNVFATKYLTFSDALNFKVAFDVKCLGEGDFDNLEVYLVKGGENLNNDNLLGYFSGINSWERKEFVVDNSYANQSVRLVLKWKNDGNGGVSPGAVVDNISIEALPCGMIDELNITFTENSGAPVAIGVIEDANSDVSSYLVEYKANGDEDWIAFSTNAPTFDILDLSYATTYAIRIKVVCDENQSVWSPIHYFTTPCGVISDFPWSEGFEQEFVSDTIGNQVAPLCWTQIVTNSSYAWVMNTIYANNGEGCLRGNMTPYFMPNPAVSSWMISPSMEFTGGEKLTFSVRKQSLSDVVRFRIYGLDESEQLFSSVSDTSRFELIRTIEYNEPHTEYTTMEVGLSSLSARGRFAFVIDTLSNTIIIDDVMVEEAEDCPNVYNVTATRLSTSSVAINFDTTNTNGSGWVIAYGQAPSQEEFDPISTPSSQQIAITSSSQLPYVIDGLSAGTYYFAVQQDCDGAFSEPAAVFFPVVNALPYFQNFNTTTVSEWDLSNHSGNNVWYIDSSMYISNNGGDSNTYDFNSQSKSYAVTYVSFPAAASFTITYDWKAMGQIGGYGSVYDYGKVYLIPDTMAIPSANINNVYAISENLIQQNIWTTDTINLDATYANRVWKLIFMWQNNASQGTNPALAVDNISIVANNCGQVVDLNVEYAQTAEGLVANLSFTDYSQNPSYIIEYKSESESEWTVISSATAPYQISNLEFNTEYSFRVAVECEDGTITPYVTITSQSPCAAITQLPWGESFNTAPNECWSFRKGQLTETTYTNDLQIPSQYEMPWQFNATNQVGGIANGRMQAFLYGTTARFWLITPTVDIPQEGVYELSVDVLARKSSDDIAPAPAPDDKFVILVSTDNGISWNTNDAIIYNDLDSDTAHNFSQFNQTPTRVKFRLQDSEGTSYSGLVRFAFYCESTVSNGSNFVFIDNIALNQFSDCPIPSNLSVSNITNNTALLTFNQDEDVEGWEYIAVPEGASIESVTPVEVAESPATIENLEAEMNYTVYLRSVCSETSVSPWSVGVSFLTTPDPTTIPYSCDFDFEQGEATGWLLKNGTCANYWAINGQLFITSDGTTQEYGSGTSVVLAEKLFQFEDSDSIRISFDLTIGGETAYDVPYDYLKVFLLPENENLEPSSAIQTPQYAYADYSQNVILTNSDGGYYINMTTQTINITLPTPTEARKLVFLWINDNSMGSQPGAIIDNFSITYATEPQTSCLAPTNLSIENSNDTITFSWQAVGSETQWEVRLGEAEPIVVETPAYQFTNLAIGQYTAYVRAICGEETYSEWASIDFEVVIVEPIVTTNDATNITANSATLTASVQLGNQTPSSAGFKYKVIGAEEWMEEIISTTSYDALSLEVSNLVAATEYEFKAFVVCGETEYEGEVKTFSTLASLQEELSNMLSVSLYPNPAKQSATLEFLGLNSKAKISIVNMKGQIIKTIDIQPLQTYELNLTDFASGVYYVKVITNNKIITQKLIVE